MPVPDIDAVIIGGGFYGAAIAIYLAEQRGLKRIVLVEREAALLKRASYNNQARVHNGYHYPRSYTTAYRSRINFPKFVRGWHDAVKLDFTMLYAIARRNSKVTANQFQRFCKEIGANLQPADPSLRGLFEPNLIEKVFLVEEYAFDTTKLAGLVERKLNECGIQILINTRVTGINNEPSGKLCVTIQSSHERREFIKTRYVFNCTYSGLNQFNGDFPGTHTELKQEITEMAIIRAPSALESLGITVMDGPFFSMMPFPARGLHSLSHVRYTPHFQWHDQKGIDPYYKLDHYGCTTRVDRMIRDVARYLPIARESKYIESLFEIKTVLIKNEGDDGRPILFEHHQELPGCYSILGGKIDNIYDVLEKLDAEQFNVIAA